MGHKDLLVTKVEVFTVSYGPSFFSHKSEQDKWGSIMYSKDCENEWSGFEFNRLYSEIVF